jgi:hypothetical protein
MSQISLKIAGYGPVGVRRIGRNGGRRTNSIARDAHGKFRTFVISCSQRKELVITGSNDGPSCWMGRQYADTRKHRGRGVICWNVNRQDLTQHCGGFPDPATERLVLADHVEDFHSAFV